MARCFAMCGPLSANCIAILSTNIGFVLYAKLPNLPKEYRIYPIVVMLP